MTENKTISATDIKRELGNISSYDPDAKRVAPTLWSLYEAALRGELHTGKPEELDPPIRVTVIGLVGKITDVRDAIAEVYDVALGELDDEDTRRGAYGAALAAYFAGLSPMYTNGEYKFDVESGKLSQKDGGPKLPTQPSRPRTEKDVEAARTKALKAKAEALQPFEAQLSTLAIADDTAIEVNTARFSALLQAEVPVGLRF